jgi:hypothetical protein
MTKKTITFELNGYEVDRMRKAINAIKDFNRTTDEKADISYDVIQNLDCVDLFLGRLIGLDQPDCEHGHRNAWADYQWIEEDAD